MTTDPTLPVDLTLEESGILCHLLLPEILKLEKMGRSKQVSSIVTPKVARSMAARMMVLYGKLTSCNDKLMGKTE